MEIVFYLIPVALIILAVAIWVFFWAVKNDQFEDMEGPATSIIFDDKEERKYASHPASARDQGRDRNHGDAVKKSEQSCETKMMENSDDDV